LCSCESVAVSQRVCRKTRWGFFFSPFPVNDEFLSNRCFCRNGCLHGTAIDSETQHRGTTSLRAVQRFSYSNCFYLRFVLAGSGTTCGLPYWLVMS
jgi:hypothetical protein